MKVRAISVTYGRKFQGMEDYESLHTEQTMWADLEDGDDAEECEKQLWQLARSGVAALSFPVLKARTAKRKRLARQGHEAASMVGK